VYVSSGAEIPGELERRRGLSGEREILDVRTTELEHDAYLNRQALGWFKPKHPLLTHWNVVMEEA
jgi:hypothetical protein